MSNKNKQHQNQQRPQNRPNYQHDRCDCAVTPIHEGMISIISDSDPTIRVYPSEYRALIESQTRIQIAKDYINCNKYYSSETLATIVGVLPKGEGSNA